MFDVVGGAAFRIAQHPKRLQDLFEERLVARVFVVRMIQLRQQPINPLNRFGLRVGADLQNLVIVDERRIACHVNFCGFL